jgi:hypothetical protein
MLFNDSIMNNIRYARISASDKEVYEACKAAAVHEKIMSFPDGIVFCSRAYSKQADFIQQATIPRLAIEECKCSLSLVVNARLT